jgi:hypothetical protein
MYYPVTVDKALKRGQLTVNVPTAALIIGGLILSTYLGATDIIAPAFMAIGLVLSFILPYLYWSVMITQWRLWAFENVRNVHELKRRAIRGQLIWPDSSFFERTEIRTSAQKAKWLLLQDRFKANDIFEEDYSLPAETGVYFSKKNAIGMLVMGPLFLAGATYFYFAQESDFLIGMMVISAGYVVIKGFKQLKNREPQITLSDDGIETANAPFYSWGDVVNAETKVDHNYIDNSAKTYLKYDSPAGEREIEINEFDINASELDRLISIYRGRYEKKQSRS